MKHQIRCCPVVHEATRLTDHGSEQMDEIVQAVPLEEWQELPADGAANVDHYLYGSEKQA